MRLSEACQLTLAEVHKIEGITCFEVLDFDDEALEDDLSEDDVKDLTFQEIHRCPSGHPRFGRIETPWDIEAYRPDQTERFRPTIPGSDARQQWLYCLPGFTLVHQATTGSGDHIQAEGFP